jgi:hypothetical protein
MGMACPKLTTQMVVSSYQHVEVMLREMISKYETQHAECTVEVRANIGNRQKALRLMRKRKLLESHIASCETRLHTCMQKQCSLEQLEIAKLQIAALKQSSTLFQRFSRRNSVARIEELTETMQELSDDLMDVNDLLQTPLAPVDDEEVLQELSAMEAEAALQELKLPPPVATVPYAVPSPYSDAGTMVATA